MKDKVKKALNKTKKKTQELPEKKKYFEFISVILSIPVLLTVLLLNINGLRSLNKPIQPTPTPNTPSYIYITQPSGNDTIALSTTPIPTDVEECMKELGPISIDYPEEGTRINDNPLNIDINYQKGKYCSAVWSYRVNSGKWSSFDNKSVSLYNLPSGETVFELRVKSLASDDETMIKRTFTYENSNDASLSPTPTM